MSRSGDDDRRGAVRTYRLKRRSIDVLRGIVVPRRGRHGRPHGVGRYSGCTNGFACWSDLSTATCCDLFLGIEPRHFAQSHPTGGPSCQRYVFSLITLV
jgi:hypothetical protein